MMQSEKWGSDSLVAGSLSLGRWPSDALLNPASNSDIYQNRAPTGKSCRREEWWWHGQRLSALQPGSCPIGPCRFWSPALAGPCLQIATVHPSRIFFIFIFFLQICHPAASSSGGRKIPLDEPAVKSLAHGPSNIPPVHPAVATYRRMNWR